MLALQAEFKDAEESTAVNATKRKRRLVIS
jgi:hypothetical protein